MKQRKRVMRRAKVARRVPTIEAAAGKRQARYLPEELAGLYKPLKKPVTLRLDADVLAWFQRVGRGYQTRINRALREVMREESNSDEKRRGSSSRKARDLRRPTRSTLVSTMASTT